MSDTLMDDLMDFDLTFAFSAGGWFQMYLYGAAQAIVETGILERLAAEGKRVRFSGSSAGSLAALCLASNEHRFELIKEFALSCGEHYRSSWRHLFHVRRYIEGALEMFGSHLKLLEENPLLLKKLNDGSFEVFVTTLPYLGRKVINQFHTYNDVTEAIMASCCLTPLVGVPFRMRRTNEWVCDGALATITPHKNEPRTITVSPFYFSASTVHPTIFVPVWWRLYPPGAVAHGNLFTLGYNDMIVGLVLSKLLLPSEGESFLRPEVHFAFEKKRIMLIWTHILDILVRIFIRPFVVTCIYVELVFMCVFYFFKGAFSQRVESIGHCYDNLRNVLSLRTLGRLVFSSKIPYNEERLERGSRLYRVFDPIVLGGKKSNGREIMSPAGVLTGQMPSFCPSVLKRAKTRGGILEN